MSPDGLRRIVQQGAEALRLTLEEDVITEIARLSAGYPRVIAAVESTHYPYR